MELCSGFDPAQYPTYRHRPPVLWWKRPRLFTGGQKRVNSTKDCTLIPYGRGAVVPDALNFGFYGILAAAMTWSAIFIALSAALAAQSSLGETGI